MRTPDISRIRDGLGTGLGVGLVLGLELRIGLGLGRLCAVGDNWEHAHLNCKSTDYSTIKFNGRETDKINVIKKVAQFF